jgi:hypothetical protein
MTRTICGLCVLLAIGIAGCGGSNGSDGPDAKPAADTPPLVGGDAQNGDGAGADQGALPKAECAQDGDCAPDMVCNCVGKCVEKGSKPCDEDKNCGGSKYCDPCSKWCYAKKMLCDPCTSEHLCNPLTGDCQPTGLQCEVEGSHCLDYATGGSFCGRACLSNAGCPSGFECRDLVGFGLEYMQCIPLAGECQGLGGCKSDQECEFKFVCSIDGICVKGCELNTECPNDMVCSAFRCTPACDPVNNPCPEGQECKDGRCLIPGGCIDYHDCLEPETFCNLTTHLCQPGCEQDVDCKSAAKICETGACVSKGCTANYWCSFGEVCTLETGACVIPPEPFCKAGCAEDTECGPEGGKCLSLQDEDGNDKGKFCFPKCYDDPENLCPQGYQCTELVDQDGKSQGSVCARVCYNEPVGFY